MTDDAELESLRQQTQHGDRLDEADREATHAELEERIGEYLAEIDAGDRQKTVSVWDGELAALVAALEDHPEDLAAVGEHLRGAFDADAAASADRSEVLRRALRLGLREAAPEYMDTLREAVRDHATQDL